MKAHRGRYPVFGGSGVGSSSENGVYEDNSFSSGDYEASEDSGSENEAAESTTSTIPAATDPTIGATTASPGAGRVHLPRVARRRYSTSHHGKRRYGHGYISRRFQD